MFNFNFTAYQMVVINCNWIIIIFLLNMFMIFLLILIIYKNTD